MGSGPTTYQYGHSLIRLSRRNTRNQDLCQMESSSHLPYPSNFQICKSLILTRPGIDHTAVYTGKDHSTRTLIAADRWDCKFMCVSMCVWWCMCVGVGAGVHVGVWGGVCYRCLLSTCLLGLVFAPGGRSVNYGWGTSPVSPRLNPSRTSRANGFKIDTCCFLARSLVLLRKGKHWLVQCQDNMTEWNIRYWWSALSVGQHYKVAISVHCLS